MGWDYIHFEGDHEQFQDSDLWTLRHFFVEEAKAMELAELNENIPPLREFFEGWIWVGVGVVTGTDFSKYVLQDGARWELVVRLLHRTGDRIADFGESIPQDYLESHVKDALDVYCGAPPTRRFLICVGRMCALITKHKPRAASNIHEGC